MIMIILGGEIAPVSYTASFLGSLYIFLGQLSIAVIFANMSIELFKRNQLNAKYESSKNFLHVFKFRFRFSKSSENHHLYLIFMHYLLIIYYLKKTVFSDINSMLDQKKVSPGLQKKVIEYFEYCWRKKVIFDEEIHDFSQFSNGL